MNVSKSIKVALAKNGRSMTWLATEIGVTKQALSRMVNGHANFSESRIREISGALNMTASSFIALGEDDS